MNMLLPIQFWTTFKNEEFESLNSQEVLDVVQDYLQEKEFYYIKRKKNSIVFHSLDISTLLNVKSFLVSGTVRVKEGKKRLRVTNGNWMVLLIGLPFLLLLLLSKTRFSTLDENDLSILWDFFMWIFVGNLIIRIVAHLTFRAQIEELIRESYTKRRINNT